MPFTTAPNTLSRALQTRRLTGSVAANALMTGVTGALMIFAAPAVMAQTAPQTQAQTSAQTSAPADAIVTQPVAPAAPQPEPRPETVTPAASDDFEEVTTVTVSAARPRNRIDREVYDPKDDPDTATSSTADILNKAPGVNVDPEGNLTLRGSSNVTVLIDGKPNVMTQGEMRAATLQSMSADDLESIEVITNPSAEFGAEGGSIINLVMKRNRRPGKTLGINLGGDSKGGKNASLSGAYNSGIQTFSGGLNIRDNSRESESHTERERIRQNGDVTRGETRNTGKNQFTNYGVSGGWDINVNDNDSLGVQAQFGKMERDNRSLNTSTDYDTDGTTPGSAYTSQRSSSGDRQNGSVRFNFNHKGDQDGETFKADLRLSKAENSDTTLATQLYSVASGSQRDNGTRQLRNSDTNNLDISVDYKRRVGDNDLAAGLELDVNRNTYDNAYYDVDMTNGDATLNTTRTNSFAHDQDSAEAYVTYQMPLGTKWTVLGGLRVEYTEVTIDQITTDIYRTNSYTKLHPSLHLSYYLGDNSKLRFSYSNRVRRPGANDLNPFIVYYNEESASAGNPDLKPQTTHSLEGGYEYSRDGRLFTLRGFYRKDEDSFVERSYYIDNNVLLTTRENGGEGQSGGIELAFNGKLTEKLSADIRGTLSYDELNSRRGGVDVKSDATSVNGRARLDYRMDPKNRFQLMVNAQGKQLTGQGYSDPVYTADMSYSHRFSNRFSVNMRVQDLFDSGERTRIIDTDTLHQRTTSNWGGRAFYIGISINPFAPTGPARDSDSDARPRGQWGGRGGGGFGGGPR